MCTGGEASDCCRPDLPALLRRRVQFTPTVQHCSMATLIGLCIRVKLLRALPQRFKVNVTFDAWLSHASACSYHAPCRSASSVPSHSLLLRVTRPLGAAARCAATSLGGFCSKPLSSRRWTSRSAPAALMHLWHCKP